MFKLIIADDEKIIRIAMQNIINWGKHNFNIVGLAKDGKEVLEILEKKGADLIITDLKMKGLDGIELIEILKNRGFKGKILVLSNHGEYELVREAMKKGASDYLLKVTLRPKELEEIIDKFAENLNEIKKNEKEKEFFKNEFIKSKKIDNISLIREYLKDEIEQDEVVSKLDEKTYFIEKEEVFNCFCICIDNHKKIYNEKIKDKNKMVTAIENIIREEFNLNKFNFIPINNHKYIVISNLNKNEIKIKSLNIQNLIKFYLNITASVVMAGEIFNLTTLKEAFKKFEEILSLRFYERENIFISREDFSGFNDAIKLRKEIVDVVEENIEDGEISANKCLMEEFVRRCDVLNVRPKDLISHVYFICELIENLEYVHEEELSEFKFLKDKILKSKNKSELVINALDYIEYVNRRYIKSRENNYKKEVNKIINFIEENIDKKITLEMVATSVNLNESYLSRIFKNETGKNLIYFINEAKMKKAKELLKDPDNLVKEVANRVGISDQFYFNRVFKKFCGVSPSKFKKEYNNKTFV